MNTNLSAGHAVGPHITGMRPHRAFPVQLPLTWIHVPNGSAGTGITASISSKRMTFALGKPANRPMVGNSLHLQIQWPSTEPKILHLYGEVVNSTEKEIRSARGSVVAIEISRSGFEKLAEN